jgi:hypothetical protein
MHHPDIEAWLEREILERARSLIANPATWSRFWYSLDGHGQRISCGNQGPVRFCAEAAIYRTVFERVRALDASRDLGRYPESNRIARQILNNVSPRLWSINRYNGRKAVLEKIDARLASLRGQSE